MGDHYEREPCPWRIADDIGGAFAMGTVGGSIFHSINGGWNAAQGHRLISMVRTVRNRAPVTGGQFAAWGGMYSMFDCALVYARKKDDPLNSIAAGALTGGVLMVRNGPAAMAGSALVGGVLLAVIEGMSIGITKWQAAMFDMTMQMDDPHALPPPSPSSSHATPGRTLDGGDGGVSSWGGGDDSASELLSVTSGMHTGDDHLASAPTMTGGSSDTKGGGSASSLWGWFGSSTPQPANMMG